MMRWLLMMLMLVAVCGCAVTARDVWQNVVLPEERTIVHREVPDGDAFFPPFEHLFDFAEDVFSTADFTVKRYVRSGNAAADPRR